MIELSLGKSFDMTIELESIVFKLVSLSLFSALLYDLHNFPLCISALDVCDVAEKSHHVFKFGLGIIHEIFKSSEQARYSAKLCVEHHDFEPVFNVSCCIFYPKVPILWILFFTVKLNFANVISSVP